MRKKRETKEERRKARVFVHLSEKSEKDRKRKSAVVHDTSLRQTRKKKRQLRMS